MIVSNWGKSLSPCQTISTKIWSGTLSLDKVFSAVLPSYTGFLKRKHFILLSCHLCIMSHRVTCEPCHMWTVSHVNRVTCEPCHMWTVSHGNRVTWEPCHMWTMPHVSHVTCEPCHMGTVSHVSHHVTCEPCHMWSVSYFFFSFCVLCIRSYILGYLRTHLCTLLENFPPWSMN
jgi:hypothetical protein